MLREEYRQRLAKEYRYAVTKMQEVSEPSRKLFYFSVFFGEAQRVLNWEWDTDLALIHMITQQVHAQITVTLERPGSLQTLPIDWGTVFNILTHISSDLATHFEKAENENSKEEIHQILGYLAEVWFSVTGNGSYLHEKGAFIL
jgi:hypothetical protein